MATQTPARTPGEELLNLLKLTKDCAATERAVSCLAEMRWVGLAAGPSGCAASEGPSAPAFGGTCRRSLICFSKLTTM